MASESEIHCKTPKKVLIPISNGTEEMEAVILIDVLRRAGAEVTVASTEEGSLKVTASRNIKLTADTNIDAVQDDIFDLIVLPGGMPGAERLRDSKILRAITERHVAANRAYAAICAAPAVTLHAWGLLHQKKATAHPAFLDKLPDAVPCTDRVVKDGQVFTSQGPGTAFELALSLVESLFGAEVAESVAGPMVMPRKDGKDTFRQEFEPISFSDRTTAPKVLVPVANGSEEMEAVVIADVLRRAGAQVTVASVERSGLTVLASRGVRIEADVAIADVANEEFDLIALPGGMPGSERLRDSAELDAILRRHLAEGRLTGAICAAPVVVLLSKGLIQSFKATAHPAFSGQLADQESVGARVVVDRHLVTSRGPGTAMEFSLTLVEKLFGEGRVREVAVPMVLSPDLVLNKS